MNRGFTLMEVMIAMAIVAISLVTATATFTQSTKNSTRLIKMMAADLAARNLMDRYRIPYRQPNKPELEQSTVTQAGFEFPYTQTMTPAALEGLKRLDITVYDSDNETALRKLSMYATVK